MKKALNITLLSHFAEEVRAGHLQKFALTFTLGFCTAFGYFFKFAKKEEISSVEEGDDLFLN